MAAVTPTMGDPGVDAVLATFPGAELVDEAGAAPERPSRRRAGPPGPRRPSGSPAGAWGELMASVEAMVGWFKENEPARLERAGWKRIVGALDACAALPDPSPGVALRSGAGDTERAAAEAVFPVSGTQRRSVLDAIAAAGDDGLCDHEVQERLGMNPSSVRPRRGELVDGGWVEDSGVRRPTPSGAEAVAWVLTVAGRRALDDS